MTHRPFALAALLALAPAVATAEEPAAQTPRERAASLAAAFPSPDPALGFDYDLDIAKAGQSIGTGRLSAAADEQGGKPAWRVEERTEMPEAGIRRSTTAWLTPSLALLRARQVDVRGDVEEATEVTRAGTGFEIVVGTGPSARRRTVEAPEATTATVPALLLFLRSAPKATGTFGFSVLRWDEDESPLQDAVIEVPANPPTAEPGPLTVEVKRGDNAFVLDLDPAGRALLGLRKGDLVIARKGLAKTEPPAPGADPAPAPPSPSPATPPDSPRAAVAALAVAWAKADLAAFSALLDWASLHAASGSKQSVEEFRASQEAALREKLPEPDAAAEARIAKAIEAAVEKTAADGAVEVTADYGRGSVTTAVRQVGGRWLVVRLPR